ncbi:hypothetical protein U9M48_009283 [Paspalum notatum var. saurae]|uniref:Uncharacterized protein n=1 Tax=Paspalum notatum var. saurae TaxID=547442 RepID=A0AAQ3WET7_PASNO
MAASAFLIAPAHAAPLVRPRVVLPPTATCCCFRCSAQRGGLVLRPPACAAPRRSCSPATRPVRFCVNAASGWPVVLTGSIRRGFHKGFNVAGMDANATGQMGDVDDDDEDLARITNEALRATIRKSKEVLARHKVILEQISEKKKLISVLADSSIHNEQEPLNVSEGTDTGHAREAYHDRYSQQPEFETAYGESIYEQNEYNGSLEDEDADFNGSFGEVANDNYQYDSFPRAASSLYELGVANGKKQDYMVQLSQASEQEQSVNEGANDNSSASGEVDVMNVILVAAECAPWSKTGKNQMI